MGKRSNYKKALTRLVDVGEAAATVSDSYRAMEEWLEGVPFYAMTPEGAENFNANVVEPAFEQVAEWWLRVLERRAKRVRPAYKRVWRYIMEEYFAGRRWDEFEEAIRESPTRLYREIGAALGLSWRTVRDAIWAVRDLLGV